MPITTLGPGDPETWGSNTGHPHDPVTEEPKPEIEEPNPEIEEEEPCGCCWEKYKIWDFKGEYTDEYICYDCYVEGLPYV